MRRLLATITLLLATTGLAAQPICQGANSVEFTSYGSTCNFFGEATLDGSYDAESCTITLSPSQQTTCCNTFLTGQFLLVGAQPFVPGQSLPILVPGCTVSVLPVIALPAPQLGASWLIRTPTFSAEITFYAQVVNDYFTTIGMNHDLQTTNALQIELR